MVVSCQEVEFGPLIDPFLGKTSLAGEITEMNVSKKYIRTEGSKHNL